MLHSTLILYLAIFVSSTSCANNNSTNSTSIRESALAIKESFTHATPIAANAQTYKDLLQNSNVFLDKSLLIKKILLTEKKTILITSPRKWGKSINLDMLKTFVEIQVDKTGSKIVSNKRRRLFEYGEIACPDGRIEKLTNPLLISNQTDLMERYLGKHPVIWLNFTRLNGTTSKYVIDDIRSRIVNALNEHVYMKDALTRAMDKDDATVDVKKRMAQNLDRFTKLTTQYVDLTELSKGLHLLSEILHDHFKQRVFIFMDDYDSILNLLLHPNFTEKDQTDSLLFFSRLAFNTFLDNKHLEKGILTGVCDIRDLLTNFEVECRYVSIITTDLDSFYGYSDDEAEALFDLLHIPELDRAKAHDWYTGYSIQEDNNLTRTAVLYNPKFVSSFAIERKVKDYRIQYPGETLFSDLLRYKRFRTIFIILVNAGYEFFEYTTLKLDIDGVSLLKDILNPRDTLKMSKDIEDLVKSYVCSVGYLGVFSDITIFAMGNLPNNQVRYEVSGELMNYYIHKYSVPPIIINDTTNILIEAIKTDHDSVENLRSTFQALVDHFPLLDDLSKDSRQKYDPEETNENFLRFIFYYIAIRISLLTDIRTEIPSMFTKPIVIFRFNRRRIALDLMVNDHQHLPDLLNATRNHPIMEEKVEGIDIDKFIVAKISTKKKVKVGVHVGNISVGFETPLPWPFCLSTLLPP